MHRDLNDALREAGQDFSFLEENLYISSNELLASYRKPDGTGQLSN